MHFPIIFLNFPFWSVHGKHFSHHFVPLPNTQKWPKNGPRMATVNNPANNIMRSNDVFRVFREEMTSQMCRRRLRQTRRTMPSSSTNITRSVDKDSDMQVGPNVCWSLGPAQYDKEKKAQETSYDVSWATVCSFFHFVLLLLSDTFFYRLTPTTVKLYDADQICTSHLQRKDLSSYLQADQMLSYISVLTYNIGIYHLFLTRYDDDLLSPILPNLRVMKAWRHISKSATFCFSLVTLMIVSRSSHTCTCEYLYVYDKPMVT